MAVEPIQQNSKYVLIIVVTETEQNSFAQIEGEKCLK